jgi:hypothetical protein
MERQVSSLGNPEPTGHELWAEATEKRVMRLAVFIMVGVVGRLGGLMGELRW